MSAIALGILFATGTGLSRILVLGIRDREEFDARSAAAQEPFVYTSQWAIGKVYSQRAADVVATAVVTGVADRKSVV